MKMALHIQNMAFANKVRFFSPNIKDMGESAYQSYYLVFFKGYQRGKVCSLLYDHMDLLELTNCSSVIHDN